MLSKEEINLVIRWVEDNPIDYAIFQIIASENSNTIEQFALKYKNKYNNYGRVLTKPMSVNIFNYIYNLCLKNPHTFNNININIQDGIINDNKGYFHPEKN